MKLVKEILFPVYCVECNREGEWWCAPCRSKHPAALVTACPACSAPTRRGEPCGGACRAVSALDGITAFFNYDEAAPVGRLIRQFKYHYARDVSRLWEAMLSSVPIPAAVQTSVESPMTVIPVPLHPRRARERGFNQAELIGRAFALQHGLAFDAVGLRRKKYTSQQAKLSRAERAVNVADAFAWQSPHPPPAQVILIDDVFTTGATMQACARELKNRGTGQVWGLAIARD